MSEDQFTKLSKSMQEGFARVDKRADNFDKQLDKLMKYTIKGFEQVDKRFEESEKINSKRFDELKNIIDGYADKIDTYAQEMAAMDHKIRRLEKYIQVLADKAGVDLDAIHA